ncbi:protein SGT1 homolog A-like [Humulus lupulus]|uniref:protein SGT1 homolog A-like n=1 Tax=Humulus lupulus TaxID=3486 RepID=UPI002B4031DE|nr:protein SGT1 homolog A-like [Humulus lupulus]
MATNLAEKAREAFVDDNFELAVDLYNQSIKLCPENADLFAERAQANIKLSNFTEAVGDANKAIELDRSIVKAYLRKGIACLKLEEYHTAKAALEVGASLAQSDSRFTKLIIECDQRIAEESMVLNKHSTPNGQASTAHVSVESLADSKEGSSLLNQIDMTSKPKYRHEFYQKPDEVVVTIFAKGIPAKNVAVEFGEQILSVTIEIPGEDAYHFQTRLFGKIIPDKCRYQVLSTKVEIRLSKAEAIHWASLEYSEEVTVLQRINVSSGSHKPVYPSSKPRSRDWDKLEAQVKKEEKEEKLDGDAALNKLFRDIYKDADEDTRRAMAKSFVESNGTVLSTDWKDVGKKKVESSPPSGMDLKKWES